jgi:hypothetical protein
MKMLNLNFSLSHIYQSSINGSTTRFWTDNTRLRKTTYVYFQENNIKEDLKTYGYVLIAKIKRVYFLSGNEWVNVWLLFNINSAIFQLSYGENKLIFNEMMMRSALY